MATESVIGGKTLRACDSCVCHRARWYCAADDAFLCQSCDSSVHSANPLARRHHRVRFQTSIKKISKCNKLAPTWHHGFKRKARTPRPSPKAKSNGGRGVSSSLVPEIETSAVDEGSNEEGEQLLYRVPTFDPVLAEFYSPTLADESNAEAKPTVQLTDHPNTISNSNSDCFLGLIQSDAELAEFAADMERLLGRGFENDSFSMEGLGFVDTKTNELVKEEFVDNNENGTIVDDGVKMYQEIDLSRETLEIDFDCRSGSDEGQVTDEYEEWKTKIGLRLDYEAVSVEWSAHGCLSPWVNGERPQLGLDDCWLNSMGMWGVEEVQGVVCGEVGGVHIDEEREARVSRYREKRRTRLFSKKIRYQVRKLNAEKRPRMKGRFVKRVSL